MKKSVWFLLALLLLGACAGGVARKGEKPQPQTYRSGTEGLRITFATNLPPFILYDTEPFSTLIEIENRGTYDVGGPGDKIYISGFDPTLIQGISTYGEQIPPIEGRGPFVSQGGFDTVNFRGTIRSLYDKKIDKYKATILATACYTYETVASANVCIDPNPFAPTTKAKVCIPASVGLGSQGAPIAVTNVEVEPAPGRTRFVINVHNSGSGDVFRFSPQSLEHCSPYGLGLGYEEVDYVQVADVTISDVSIRPSCKPLDATGHIRLVNGVGKLYCEYTQPRGQSPYTTPLNVILKYGYRQAVSRPIEIRPVA